LKSKKFLTNFYLTVGAENSTLSHFRWDFIHKKALIYPKNMFFTREYTQCTAGYTFCFVVVVGGGGAGATFNQTWEFQLTVDET
jgi:hypothetical protein